MGLPPWNQAFPEDMLKILLTGKFAPEIQGMPKYARLYMILPLFPMLSYWKYSGKPMIQQP